MIENEAEYLELMNELKVKHEKLEAEERALKLREAKYKVDITTIFGLVRAGDKLLQGIEAPDDFLTIWELICDFVFTSTKKNILDIPLQEQPLQMEIHVINEQPAPEQPAPNPDSEPEND